MARLFSLQPPHQMTDLYFRLAGSPTMIATTRLIRSSLTYTAKATRTMSWSDSRCVFSSFRTSSRVLMP